MWSWLRSPFSMHVRPFCVQKKMIELSCFLGTKNVGIIMFIISTSILLLSWVELIIIDHIVIIHKTKKQLLFCWRRMQHQCSNDIVNRNTYSTKEQYRALEFSNNLFKKKLYHKKKKKQSIINCLQQQQKWSTVKLYYYYSLFFLKR